MCTLAAHRRAGLAEQRGRGPGTPATARGQGNRPLVLPAECGRPIESEPRLGRGALPVLAACLEGCRRAGAIRRSLENVERAKKVPPSLAVPLEYCDAGMHPCLFINGACHCTRLYCNHPCTPAARHLPDDARACSSVRKTSGTPFAYALWLTQGRSDRPAGRVGPPTTCRRRDGGPVRPGR